MKKERDHVATAPKSVSPADRVKGYSGQNLTVSNKKLFCLGCRDSVKKSVIELHIKSKKHVRGKEQLGLKEKRELDIAKPLQKYDCEVHPSGEMLPDSTRAYREQVSTLLRGASLRSVEQLRL